MKKFLLSAALFSSAILAGYAQTLSFLDKDNNVIENGSTYVFEGSEIWGTVEDGKAVGFAMLVINPELSIVSTTDAMVTVRTSSRNDSPYQLCAGGECVISTMVGPVITKDKVNLTADKIQSLELDANIQFMDGEEVITPYYDILVEAWYNDNPNNKISFTLHMGNLNDAGVEGISALGTSVSVIGKSLKYDVVGNSTLSVYSLSGKTLVSKNIAGTGNISLANLPKGVYVYKLSGKNGKSGKFIIR